jgi:hypothetical protein
MPEYTVDVIEWDGRQFSVLIAERIVIFVPDFDRVHESLTVTLDSVRTEQGRPVRLEVVDPVLIADARVAVLAAWADYEASHGHKLLRQPATSLLSRDPPQRESAEEFIDRLVEEINRRRFKR